MNHSICEHTSKKPIVGVVGLGYVGLPVALGFSKKYKVIGFDIDEEKIKQLAKFQDPTKQITKEELKKSKIDFVSTGKRLSECSYIIITVPTPLTPTNEPDLSYLKHASQLVAKHLSPQTYVIFESTVFPGTTEEVCIPILESISTLKVGKDFFVGYSPERINPGDPNHHFINIPKIVSGQNEAVLKKIATLYRSILQAEVYEAPSIKVAEAAKVLENTQRDINIALMNEFSLICHKLNINTREVIKAAETKWNFIPFTPGLVGGHCIGVDPYYLIYQSKKFGYHPKFIETARKVNDDMPTYIVQSMLRLLVENKVETKNLRVAVLGITFKEDVPDTRNSKALEIVQQLKKLGISLEVYDPMVDPSQIKKQYDLDVKSEISELKPADAVILAIAHKPFQSIDITSLCRSKTPLIMDIQGQIDSQKLPEEFIVWRL